MKKEKCYCLKLSFILVFVVILAYGCKKDEGAASITDPDGNVYHQVIIGTQTWMVENLKTTKYKDGTAIPNTTAATAWHALITPSFCWYNNDEAANMNTYGALYNWYAVNTGNLCPTGWHVPTDSEWTALGNYLGGETIAGGKLKETGTTHWLNPNTGATNETGFLALPGGNRDINGNFGSIGSFGTWWSSTEMGTAGAWYRYLSSSDSQLLGNNFFQNFAYSVRCMKN
jgi:uncharacterized protein (TIGR02145 family)